MAKKPDLPSPPTASSPYGVGNKGKPKNMDGFKKPMQPRQAPKPGVTGAAVDIRPVSHRPKSPKK